MQTTVTKYYNSILNFLVYLAITLLVISDSGVQVFILTMFGPNSRILRKIAFTLLLTKVFCTKYRKKEFFIILPFALLALYNYKIGGNIYGIYNVLIVASLKNIDFSLLFKCAFWGGLATILLLGILSLFQIGGALYLTENFGRGSLETRYCFGLNHPNIWHQTFARCIVYFILGYDKKISWIHLFCIFIINLVAYKFTLSRTGLLCVSIFVILYFFYKYLDKIAYALISKVLIVFMFFFTNTFFIYAYYVLSTKWSPWVVEFSEKFTTGRIFQAVLFIREHPITLWGTPVPDGFVFDFGLLRMLFEYGYICGIIFLIVLAIVFLYSQKHNLGIITCVSVFVSLYSLYEAPIIGRAPNNISVFFIALLIYNFNKINSESNFKK